MWRGGLRPRTPDGEQNGFGQIPFSDDNPSRVRQQPGDEPSGCTDGLPAPLAGWEPYGRAYAQPGGVMAGLSAAQATSTSVFEKSAPVNSSGSPVRRDTA
jgi:hypothetical protein